MLNIFHSFFLGNSLLERQKVTFASKTLASFLVSSSLKDFTSPALPALLSLRLSESGFLFLVRTRWINLLFAVTCVTITFPGIIISSPYGLLSAGIHNRSGAMLGVAFFRWYSWCKLKIGAGRGNLKFKITSAAVCWCHIRTNLASWGLFSNFSPCEHCIWLLCKAFALWDCSQSHSYYRDFLAPHRDV